MTTKNPDGLTGELNQRFQKVLLDIVWELESNVCMCLHQDFLAPTIKSQSKDQTKNS